MNNQLTPMQEAIEKITKLQKNENITGFTKRSYATCLDILTELIPKEQEVIEDAFLDGFTDSEFSGIDYKTYYNTKFKNNDK